MNHCACPYVFVFVCAERQEVSGENTDPHSLFDSFLRLQFFCIPSTKTQTWNCFCFNVICHLSFIHFAQGFCVVLTFARLHIKRHLIVLGARERIRDHIPSRLRKLHVWCSCNALCSARCKCCCKAHMTKALILLFCRTVIKTRHLPQDL